MADVISSASVHLHDQLTRSLERILEEANQSGELRLCNRKLKDFPKAYAKYNLTDTVTADLSKNRLSELPEEITGFAFLEKLTCHHNAIRYLPESVSNFHCLNYIDLSRNQLTVLPKELCYLPIQILLVSNNRLEYLPDELGRMSQLTELDASGNLLTHLPPRLGELCCLKSLILRSNLLLCVPVEITSLSLARLDLRANRITTLPIDMISMSTLIDFLVDDNPLTSPPASLCKRGRVHIFKYLETEAVKLDYKTGTCNSGNNTLSKKLKRNLATTGPALVLPNQLSQKKPVDNDICDNHWTLEVTDDIDKSWESSNLSNNLNAGSLTDCCSIDEDPCKVYNGTVEGRGELQYNKFKTNSVPVNNNAVVTEEKKNEEKCKLQQIQTYKEYKEALRQQRAQDVPSVYRIRDLDNHNYKTEPNTPTHHSSPSRNTLATSKSDPTPLNSIFSSPKHVFDDTNQANIVQKRSQAKIHSPQKYSQLENSSDSKGEKGFSEYIKPKPIQRSSPKNVSQNNTSPLLSNSGSILNGKPSSPRIADTIKYFNGAARSTNGLKSMNVSWNQDVPPDKISFTMKREIDKAKEESEMIEQLRNIIETRLKMALPEDIASALTDGVVLCHLANHIKPRSVASIHVPSPAVPKLTMARCRRNVDNFIEACRKIGVDEDRLCSSVDVTEALAGRGLPRLLDTVEALCQLRVEAMQPTMLQGYHNAAVSLLLLGVFNLVCCAADVLEGRGLVQVAITVAELLRFYNRSKSPISSLNIPNIS